MIIDIMEKFSTRFQQGMDAGRKGNWLDLTIQVFVGAVFAMPCLVILTLIQYMWS